MSFSGSLTPFDRGELRQPAQVTQVALHGVGAVARLERQVVAEALEPEGPHVLARRSRLTTHCRLPAHDCRRPLRRTLRQLHRRRAQAAHPRDASSQASCSGSDRSGRRTRLPHLLDQLEPALALHLAAEALAQPAKPPVLARRFRRGRRLARRGARPQRCRRSRSTRLAVLGRRARRRRRRARGRAAPRGAGRPEPPGSGIGAERRGRRAVMTGSSRRRRRA